jgi:hypothetical protein
MPLICEACCTLRFATPWKRLRRVIAFTAVGLSVSCVSCQPSSTLYHKSLPDQVGPRRSSSSLVLVARCCACCTVALFVVLVLGVPLHDAIAERLEWWPLGNSVLPSHFAVTRDLAVQFAGVGAEREGERVYVCVPRCRAVFATSPAIIVPHVPNLPKLLLSLPLPLPQLLLQLLLSTCRYHLMLPQPATTNQTLMPRYER